MKIEIKRLTNGADMPLPAYQTNGSAGMDLYAALAEDVVIDQGAYRLIPCGIAMAIPDGHEGQVRSRSGLALKHGIAVLNAPGTIDSDYRGEVGVVLINHGALPFVVSRGMRIAQLLIARVEKGEWAEVSELSATDRGAGGYGHTGHKA